MHAGMRRLDAKTGDGGVTPHSRSESVNELELIRYVAFMVDLMSSSERFVHTFLEGRLGL